MKLYVIKDPPFKESPPVRGEVVQVGGFTGNMLFNVQGGLFGTLDLPITQYAVPASRVLWKSEDGVAVKFKMTKKFLKTHKPIL